MEGKWYQIILIKKGNRELDMTWLLQTIPALVEDPNLNPNNHTRQFTATYNSSFRGSNVLFFSP